MGRLPPSPPRRAGRSPWRAANLVALDFETTGLDLRRDHVVSFGIVPVADGRVDLSGSVYEEVAPAVEPSASSIRIHHLRPLDLARAPRLETVVEHLRDGLSHRYLLAWAAGVEIAFLRRTFGGAVRRWRSRTIDVRTLLMALDRLEGGTDVDAEHTYSLEAAATRFGVPVEQTHHALDDAFMTAELFLLAATRLERRGLGTVRSLLDITNGRRRTDPFHVRGHAPAPEG